MSEDPPSYSIYAEAAPDQAEACFHWLSENMTQWVGARATFYTMNKYDYEDIFTTGFKDDAQREGYRIRIQSPETERRMLRIHYRLADDVISKLRKELPACFVNPVICQVPFYPGASAEVCQHPDYCIEHQIYHFDTCLICRSTLRGITRILAQILWEVIVSRFTERFKSLFHKK